MISAQFLLGSVLLREVQKYAKKNHILKNFKSALYSTLGNTFTVRIVPQRDVEQYFKAEFIHDGKRFFLSLCRMRISVC